ncbi:patatin-like phospholipase family protein [Phyllobacterium salinisoli]|uniref:Patatin-like phospholipase family protein n=1 Tax=Phyllobacterium salinisoli TaxID=1899321 RepID=A0A368K945_9HYPH|nr:patatin-like phospholipase family protein [Phyllobacterium salinisoli]RCS24600.1 patatin-like phospholipase family protein [Phyllobacterium salinisoli]
MTAASTGERVARPGPSVAVAFGGGGARGIAHVNVIEALDEMGIRPVAISGSSIGAIMGAGMAAGMSGREIRAYCNETLANRAQVAGRMWKMRPTSISEILAGGIRFTQFNIEKILKAFLPERLPTTFEELEIPLAVTATDFYGQQEVIIESGDLISAIAASAAIPALFRPIRRDGRILIDGGIYNPVPFELLEEKADIVIAIDVVGGPVGDDDKMPSSIDAMFGASQLMMQSIIATKLKRTRPVIFLRPQVSRFGVLDFMRVAPILRESVGVKDELKHALDAALTFSESRRSA